MGIGAGDRRALALRFVVGIGVVSLFADFTYEGARSINGPFLATLGVGAFWAGAIAGGGEFLGYLVRLFSGRWADRHGGHWRLMAVGYGLNMLSVPLLALAGGPALAAALIFLERLGKGLRNPPRDALLAQAGEVIGHGRAFGLHELLDQIGALAGPLAVSGLLLWGSGDYRLAYAGLLVTALLALLALWRASGLQALPAPPVGAQRPPLPRVYFLYLAFVAVGVAGFGHFVLIAWVLQATHRVAPVVIPLLFALAMAVDAVAAYLVGMLHDRFGLRTLYALPVLALPATPLFFLGHSLAALLLATVLWGAALGLQESLMRAALARLLPGGARGFAYGLFDTVYGAAWFAGSLLLGALYAWRGALGVSVASVAFQVLAIALLPVLMREVRRRDPRGA